MPQSGPLIEEALGMGELVSVTGEEEWMVPLFRTAKLRFYLVSGLMTMALKSR